MQKTRGAHVSGSSRSAYLQHILSVFISLNSLWGREHDVNDEVVEAILKEVVFQKGGRRVFRTAS